MVTTTSASPAECAPVFAVIEVDEMIPTLVAAVPPMVTVAPVTKPVPVMVTSESPASGPLDGAIDVIVGAARYANPLAKVPVCASVFVTTTATVPVPIGVVAVIEVAEPTLTLVADAPPNVTVAPVTNPVPVIVTAVPPAGSPPFGDTAETVGAARYVNPPDEATKPPGAVSATSTAPAACAGVVTITVVPVTVPKVPATPSNVTEVVPVKLVPVIVTIVPPAGRPPFGTIEVIVGGATKVKIGPVAVPIEFTATIRK